MIGGEVECPECSAVVEIEADWRFHDRHDLDYEGEDGG